MKEYNYCPKCYSIKKGKDTQCSNCTLDLKRITIKKVYVKLTVLILFLIFGCIINISSISGNIVSQKHGTLTGFHFLGVLFVPFLLFLFPMSIALMRSVFKSLSTLKLLQENNKKQARSIAEERDVLFALVVIPIFLIILYICLFFNSNIWLNIE